MEDRTKVGGVGICATWAKCREWGRRTDEGERNPNGDFDGSETGRLRDIVREAIYRRRV